MVSIDQVEEIVSPSYQELLKKIAVADMVVASRLHSIILSHVLNKPTLAISWDRKVQAHMQDFDQSRYMIDIHSLNGDILKEKFDELERDAEVISNTLRDKIDSIQADLEKQSIELLKHAGA
jgi:polysaccharide pyruvyl transferase WcaK-like protein